MTEETRQALAVAKRDPYRRRVYELVNRVYLQLYDAGEATIKTKKAAKEAVKAGVKAEVLMALYLGTLQPGVRLTQAALCKLCPGLGPHEIYEPEKMSRSKKETTERKLRGVIKSLRVHHFVPILAVSNAKRDGQKKVKGYYFPCTAAETIPYIAARMKETEATCKSKWKTFHAMKETCNDLAGT